MTAAMKLSADKMSLAVSLNKTLSADDVQALICDLSDLRASMEPPVPPHRPRPNSGASAENILVQDEPSVIAIPLKDGGVRFWLRSHGLGWLLFNFTANQAASLREFFISCTYEDERATSLFTDDVSNQGPSH